MQHHVEKVVWHGRETRKEVDVGRAEARALEKMEGRRADKSNLRSAENETRASTVRGAKEWWVCAAGAKTLFEDAELEGAGRNFAWVGGRGEHATDCRPIEKIAVNGEPRDRTPRRGGAISCDGSRPEGMETCKTTEAVQTAPEPNTAEGSGSQNGAALVAGADIGMVKDSVSA